MLFASETSSLTDSGCSWLRVASRVLRALLHLQPWLSTSRKFLGTGTCDLSQVEQAYASLMVKTLQSTQASRLMGRHICFCPGVNVLDEYHQNQAPGRLEMKVQSVHYKHNTSFTTTSNHNKWTLSGMMSWTASTLHTFIGSSGSYVRMLILPCSRSYGIQTRRPFIIAQLPFSRWQVTQAWTFSNKSSELNG